MVDVKKRWRAWLRAVHRDFGYLAIGFTVIYAVSGIAQNHIEDWGDVSYKTTERTLAIPAMIVRLLVQPWLGYRTITATM